MTSRWGVAALGFGVFAVGTGEFVLAGLLSLLSESFRICETTAGQVVTTFALAATIAAPLLGALTGAWPRRRVLLVAVLASTLGNAATALAPTFPVVLVAQAVAAAGVGMFVPAASVTAAALVPPERQGRAIAATVTGFTAATALGVPLGTAIGGAVGWRATMWFVTVLTVLGLAGVLTLIPKRIPTPAAPGLRERLRPLGDRRALALFATTLTAFTAVYIPYTYISVIFTPATGGSGGRLAVLLFTLGIVGLLGNLAAGALADRWSGRPVVTVALIALAVGLVILPLTTAAPIPATVMIAAYGFAAFAITTPQQHRLITLDPESASVLIPLNQAVLYLAISLSGLVGAAGIRWLGANRVSILAAMIAVLALSLSELANRLARRPLAEPHRTGKDSRAFSDG
ncbi:MFS transporter [Streptomyces spongiae]|uniref:MFS transporter n=1 Tax=Streptomyces spongiae TaxID=565072 RepID=A0A5N8X9I6_9ACTN|nr:MFS transporter [Streptomyces spongiae]